jgi:hypothetical protein
MNIVSLEGNPAFLSARSTDKYIINRWVTRIFKAEVTLAQIIRVTNVSGFKYIQEV